jgi:hypothetical protein
MDVVSTVAGNRVDHRAGGTPVFGGEVGGIHLELSYRCLTDDVADASASALLAEECLVIVATVHGAVV